MILTILLQVHEAHEAGVDYGAIVGGIAVLTSGGGWVKMLTDKATMKEEIRGMREKLLEQTASKKGMRREFDSKLAKLEIELKEDRESNKQEFKEINKQLTEINGGIGEIKGMISK